MNAQTIIERACSEGLIFTLAESGNIKARGDHEVVIRWQPLLKQHKEDIVNLLMRKEPDRVAQTIRQTLPEWCDHNCEHYHRLDLPDLDTMQWCCWEIDETHWQRDRIDKMNGCPVCMERPRSTNKNGRPSAQG